MTSNDNKDGLTCKERMMVGLMGKRVISVDKATSNDYSIECTAYKHKGTLFVTRLERK